MVISGSRVQGVPKSEFDLSGLNASYQPLNGAGFANPVRVLKIYNPSTTVSIDVSFDGVEDNDFIPPLSTLIVDFQANHESGPVYDSGVWKVSRYQILWGKTASNPTFLQIIGYT